MPDGSLVHVVDDDQAVRDSVQFVLRGVGYDVRRWPGGEAFLKEADNSERACVLLDVRMPGLDGLAVQERMIENGLDFPVIMLTGHAEVDLAVKAMKQGATDFLQKPFARDRLIEAVANGFRVLADQNAGLRRTRWAQAQLGKLTEREREVLDGLACGYPNKTIAFDLGISPRTVEVYRANVMAKLDVTNFADALRVAFAAGLGSEKDWRSNHAGK